MQTGRQQPDRPIQTDRQNDRQKEACNVRLLFESCIISRDFVRFFSETQGVTLLDQFSTKTQRTDNGHQRPLFANFLLNRDPALDTRQQYYALLILFFYRCYNYYCYSCYSYSNYCHYCYYCYCCYYYYCCYCYYYYN